MTNHDIIELFRARQQWKFSRGIMRKSFGPRKSHDKDDDDGGDDDCGCGDDDDNVGDGEDDDDRVGGDEDDYLH